MPPVTEGDSAPEKQGAEPIKVKTPKGGHIVLLKPFVTGRARAAIRGVLLSQMQVTGKTGQKDDEGEVHFTAAATQEANLKAMELLIISVDGDATEPYDAVLDMHEDDYQAVYDKVAEITNVSELSKKK